jgi:hypothetical protein
MPIKTEYLPQRWPAGYDVRKDGTICKTYNEQVDPVGIRYERVYNDVQKRPKPGALLENLTSLPKQKTSVVWKGCYKFVSSGTTRGRCVPNVGNEYVYVHRYYPFPGPVAEVWVEEPDWVLPLRLKMQSDKVNLADTLGEWREAMRLMGDTRSFFVRAARETAKIFRSRRKVRQATKAFKRLFKRRPQDRWELGDYVQMDLLIKFGIRPTVQTLEDIADALDRIAVIRRRYQVTLRKRYDAELPAEPGYSGALITHARRSARAIAYVTFDVNNPAITAGNIAESLWAGTRLSFVVDWFWNFGSYLTGFNAMDGVTSFRGTVGHRIVATRSDSRTAYVSGGTRTTFRPAKSTFKSYERTVMLSLPAASLPKLTPLSEAAEWSKWISLREILYSMRQSRRA